MNDQPPGVEQAADSSTTDARRGPAVGGALAGTAVILILAAGVIGVGAAGPDSRTTPAGPTGAAPSEPASMGTASPGPVPAPPEPAATPALPEPAAAQDGAAPTTVSTPAALSTRPTARPGRARKLTRLTLATLVRGHGPKVRAGQQVTVNYVLARYRTGEELDASWDTGRPLPPFLVGSGAVIEGFDRGLVGVPVGSRIRLDVPARLAYGDPAPPGRPSGDLRFIVDVLAAR